MKQLPPDKYMTVKAVARYLSVSPSLVYKLVNAGHITGTRVGRCWRILTDDIEAFENTHASSDS